MTLGLASLAPTVLASSAPHKMTVGVIGGMIYNTMYHNQFNAC